MKNSDIGLQPFFCLVYQMKKTDIYGHYSCPYAQAYNAMLEALPVEKDAGRCSDQCKSVVPLVMFTLRHEGAPIWAGLSEPARHGHVTLPTRKSGRGRILIASSHPGSILLSRIYRG